MGNHPSGHEDGGEMAATHWEFEVDEIDPEIDVVEAVAQLEDVDSTDLSPIYDTVDHLVDHLFSDPPAPEAEARLEFTYEGYRIVLDHDGHATFIDTDRER